MSNWKILAVDDEPYILTLIQEFLKDEAEVIDVCPDAFAAWELLTKPDSCYDFIILDRIMPGFDGMELLRRIKADHRLAAVPVIIQSGATSPEQIAEGIEAGAYYYLTKPYEPRSLVCIARAVKSEITLRREAASELQQYREGLHYFQSAELTVRTLADVTRVTGVLAAMCPDPDTVSTGIQELLINGVEHGNLAISYEEKKQLMYDGRWEQELEHRLALPEFAGRQVRVRFERQPDELLFTIADQGSGFSWDKYLELDPHRSLDPNGRGIAMARRFSFATLEYRGCGNEVVATVAL